MPGYDVDGKLWTIQYIKEDEPKRFAKDSRKHGCFHVVGAPNGAAALQKIAMSPVRVIAEGYATAATLAEHGKVPTLAAYDSGNLLSVAASIRERWPDKAIIIAGDDDHRIENNPGREKALATAQAVDGIAIFPNFSAEQRAQGLTDFNDLGAQNPELVSQQLTSTKNIRNPADFAFFGGRQRPCCFVLTQSEKPELYETTTAMNEFLNGKDRRRVDEALSNDIREMTEAFLNTMKQCQNTLDKW